MNTSAEASPALAIYAKVVVACTLVLIFLGGLVTSWQAGMAVPDWPLSFGTLNPHNWWANSDVRLEHGHRQAAAFVGLLITVLCAAVWRNFWPLLWAAIASAGLTIIGRLGHLPGLMLMHVSIWSFALAFAVALLLGEGRASAAGKPRISAAVRWLAFAAFVTVCLQATLGGLRVVLNNLQPEAALVFRIFHGCLAQAMLCLLVILAAWLSPVWREPISHNLGRGKWLPSVAWVAVIAVFLQLIAAATMRHQGAGLAISSFPAARPDGSLVPTNPNVLEQINFAHTRIGALLVTVLIVALAVSVLSLRAGDRRLRQPALFLLALLGIQLTLGVFVIWHFKPPTLTTFHVANGALLLATSLLLALRLQQRAGSSPAAQPAALPAGAVPLSAR